MHDLPLLVNIAVALAYALIGGLVARQLRLPTLVGYLLAGVAFGPFTPGVRGDVEAIRQLAELGIILLMFGVGLHFSLHDLFVVRRVAVPGALLQMTFATSLGYLLAVGWGWLTSAAIVLGVSISVASTVCTPSWVAGQWHPPHGAWPRRNRLARHGRPRNGRHTRAASTAAVARPRDRVGCPRCGHCDGTAVPRVHVPDWKASRPGDSSKHRRRAGT